MRHLVKLFLLFNMAILSLNGFSQKPDSLDFKTYIEKITTDPSSSCYYPILLEKLENHPGELNISDCFYLYYGQIFQKDYHPLAFLGNPERSNFEKAIMRGNCKKVIELGSSLLKQYPIDLTILLHVANCMHEKNNSDNPYYEQRFKLLLDAIFSSGDGKSMETAIRIVNMEDDYIIKGVLGFLGGEESLRVNNDHGYSIWEKNGQKLYFEDVMNIK